MHTSASFHVSTGLFVGIVGPFGSGKSKIVEKLVDQGLRRVVTVTARTPRIGEVQNVDYTFTSDEEFDAWKRQGKFLEHANVHGRKYGTLRASVLSILQNGSDAVVHIDIQGVQTIKRSDDPMIANAFVTFYIEVDRDTCIRRARNRDGGMPDDEIERRLVSFGHEENNKGICDYRIPNPDGGLDAAVARILQTIARRKKEILCFR